MGLAMGNVNAPLTDTDQALREARHPVSQASQLHKQLLGPVSVLAKYLAPQARPGSSEITRLPSNSEFVQLFERDSGILGCWPRAGKM